MPFATEVPAQSDTLMLPKHQHPKKLHGLDAFGMICPCNKFIWRRGLCRACFHLRIPTGFKSISPGLRGTSYPGLPAPKFFNPEGVASPPLLAATPSELFSFCPFTQRRCLRTATIAPTLAECCNRVAVGSARRLAAPSGAKSLSPPPSPAPSGQGLANGIFFRP